jgi:hypothetical protein
VLVLEGSLLIAGGGSLLTLVRGSLLLSGGRWLPMSGGGSQLMGGRLGVRLVPCIR